MYCNLRLCSFEGDICLAARCNSLDPEEFLKDLETADALALAAIPITLEMLLQTGELTSNRLELYEEGIRTTLPPSGGARTYRKSDCLSASKQPQALRRLCFWATNTEWTSKANQSVNLILSVRDLLRDSDSENEEKLARDTLNTGLFEGGQA